MSHHDPTHTHDHPPVSVYLGTLVALAVLMFATVLVYKFDVGVALAHKLGQGDAFASILNTLIWVGIATVKAYLVVRNFMGVKWSSGLVKVWAVMGFVTLPLMIMMFGDVTTRHWEDGDSWNGGGERAKYRSDIDPHFKELNEKYGHSEGHGEEHGSDSETEEHSAPSGH